MSEENGVLGEASEGSDAVAIMRTGGTSPAERVHQVVEDWFFEHVHNSPIAREQAAWAHALQAKEALKATLLAALF